MAGRASSLNIVLGATTAWLPLLKLSSPANQTVIVCMQSTASRVGAQLHKSRLRAPHIGRCTTLTTNSNVCRRAELRWSLSIVLFLSLGENSKSTREVDRKMKFRQTTTRSVGHAQQIYPCHNYPRPREGHRPIVTFRSDLEVYRGCRQG